MASLTALRALVRKDLVLYFSNRRALLVTVAAPIAIAAFFGSLFGNTNQQPSRIPIAVVDRDGSALSTRVKQDLERDATFDAQPLDAPGHFCMPRGSAGHVYIFIWIETAGFDQE